MIKASQSTKQKMSQSFVFTQNLAKNISLLAHPVTQIRNDVLKELEENPALELQEEPDHDSLEALENIKNNGADAQKKFEFVESLLVAPQTLNDYLLQQLHLELDDELAIEIGTKIISNLDDHGFYQDDPVSLCSDIPKATQQDIHDVLQRLQVLDPIGCATSGVIESLRVQINQLSLQTNSDKNTINKVTECINLIEKTQLSKNKNINKEIQEQLHKYTDEPQFQELLHSLTPYPGLAYNSHYDMGHENYIVPDAFIEIVEEDSIRVAVNNTIIPIISVKEEMRKIAEGTDIEAAQFASEFIQTAQSFITGLKYRASTLEKVIGFLAHYHIDFFTHKQEYPAALTRSHIAKELQLNESTVSRIISGKYIQTPRGMIEIKNLLSHSIGSTHISAERVRQEIQNIITNNTEKNISDNTISQLLSQKGINLARRTVAKYRKQLEDTNT